MPNHGSNRAPPSRAHREILNSCNSRSVFLFCFTKLLRHVSTPDAPLIAFGGMSEIVKMKEALSIAKVVGIGVGNFLHYSEHSVQKYKEHLECTALRLPKYQLPLNR